MSGIESVERAMRTAAEEAAEEGLLIGRTTRGDSWLAMYELDGEAYAAVRDRETGWSGVVVAEAMGGVSYFDATSGHPTARAAIAMAVHERATMEVPEVTVYDPFRTECGYLDDVSGWSESASFSTSRSVSVVHDDGGAFVQLGRVIIGGFYGDRMVVGDLPCPSCGRVLCDGADDARRVIADIVARRS